MIQLTKTEAMFIEEVLQEMLSSVENEENMNSTEDISEALNIIRSCNAYSEEQMIVLEQDYMEEDPEEGQ